MNRFVSARGRLGAALALVLAIAPAAVRAGSPVDGRYSLDADPSVVVRITSDAGGLLVTAEGLGAATMPRHPNYEPEIQIPTGRFFNGRFEPPAGGTSWYHKTLSTPEQALSAYQLMVRSDLTVSWTVFPDPAMGVPGFRKEMHLVRAPMRGVPTLAQDLAGVWVSGTEAYEIYAAGDGIALIGVQPGAPFVMAAPIAMNPAGAQAFRGGVYDLVVLSAQRVRISFNGAGGEFERSPASVAIAGASERMGLARKTAQGDTLLHQAVASGDAAALQDTLAAGVIDVNARNNRGRTALHLAVEAANEPMIDALLRAGASATLADGAGKTPLQLAASAANPRSLAALQRGGVDLAPVADAAVKAGDLAAVRRLLAGGVSGATIAGAAIAARRVEVLEEVLTSQPALANNALFDAATVDAELARSVLAYAASNAFDEDAALRSALARNRAELVPDLLQAGAKPQAALDYAVAHGDVALLKQLVQVHHVDAGLALASSLAAANSAAVQASLDAGADPTPGLAPAIAARKAALVKLLIDGGADAAAPALIQQATANGDVDTVAHLLAAGAPAQAAVATAVSSDAGPVLTQLIAGGADVSDPTLLVDATKTSRAAALAVLLKAGGNPNAKDASGRPLIVIAAASADVPTLSVLLQAGADKEAADASGNRAIHVAVVRSGSSADDRVDRLIQAGVDVNAPDGQGRVPRALASGVKIPLLLRRAGAQKSLEN